MLSFILLPISDAIVKLKKTHSNNAIVGEKEKKIKEKSFRDEDTEWLHKCRDYAALTPNCQQTARGILHADTLLMWSKVTSVISLSRGLVFLIGLLLGHSSKLTMVTCPLLAGLWTFIRAAADHCSLPEAAASLYFANLPIHYFLHLIWRWHSALRIFNSAKFSVPVLTDNECSWQCQKPTLLQIQEDAE